MLLFALWGCPFVDTTDSTSPEPDADTDADSDSDTDPTGVDTDAVDTDTAPTDTDPGCDPAFAFPADDGAADLVLSGTEDIELTGRALLVTDHDGDGMDDLLIGAPYVDTAAGQDPGRVWVLYGPLSGDGPLDTVADAWIDANGVEDYLGWYLGDLGDIDADGFADVAVTAVGWPEYATTAGKVWVRSGTGMRLAGGSSVVDWDASIAGESPENHALGDGITGIGDMDGDGFDDIAFADPGFDPILAEDPQRSGRLYVVPGRAGGLDGELDPSALPQIEGTEDDVICAGRCIASEDFDGDGLVDLVFAADAAEAGKNRVWLRYGDGTFPDAELVEYYPRLQKDTTYGAFGNEVRAVGDLDGDGYPELAVADETADDVVYRGGRVYVVRGGSARWSGTGTLESTAWLTVEGVEEDAQVGSAVLGLGDVDCDGFDDLAVGAAFANGLVDKGGAVGLWLAPGPGVYRLSGATAVVDGGVGSQGFGQSLATGDLDGDGLGDLVVAAPSYGIATGRVYVFFGSF